MRQRLITDWDQVPIIMDLPLAARIVGKSPETLKKLAQRGGFPAYKDGKFWRVTKEALLEHTRTNMRKEATA